LIEVFSAQAHAFSQSEERVLQKLSDIVFDAATRALRAENLPSPATSKAESFSSPQGSVLFASADEDGKKEEPAEESGPSSITLPRSYLILLTAAAAAISMVLGLFTAPWIQSSAAPWILKKIHSRQHAQLQTVLASSNAPSAAPTIETATFSQLQQMAESGDPAAQNALGLRYFQGDPAAGVKQNELEAARWFTVAAERGNVAAQSKLGFLFWSGRGVPKDLNRAYLWTIVACENSSAPNDPAVVLSQDLARVLRQQMTREQSKTIEAQAKKWLRLHETPSKPEAGQNKQS
jgi:TPR repeat protein